MNEIFTYSLIGISVGRHFLTKKGKVAYAVSANDEKCNVTVLFTACADGTILPPVYIH